MTTFAERMVSVAEAALAAGPMGNTLRPAEYREFARCDYPLAQAMANGGDIGAIATSCGIFYGAVLHHAGLKRTKKPRWGGPLLSNWVPLSQHSDSWRPFPAEPEPGDGFFVGSLTGSNGHVGVFLREIAPGQWITAEGGGGADGTRCSIRTKPRIFDPANRHAFDPRGLTGIWKASIIGESLRDTLPAPCSDSEPPTVPAFRRTLKLTLPRMSGDDVKAWQAVVGADSDGVFGPLTDKATRVWQAAHGLKDDGEVGPLTRAKAGL